MNDQGGRVFASRYHDFSAGHRVAGHESKCALLHGHNYRVHFTVSAPALDAVGRVVDFSVIKSTLCQWLEDQWDHRMLLWSEDQLAKDMMQHLWRTPGPMTEMLRASVVWVPFNPTAENMARHLALEVAPKVLPPGMAVAFVKVEETRKCGASFQPPPPQEPTLLDRLTAAATTPEVRQ